MSIKIITISREFGSGGHSIGQALAERLQLPFYDKELIRQVAEKTGFDPKYIEENGESTQSKGLLAGLFGGTGTPQGGMGGMSTADYLWVMQRQVILDLAEKGPCVLVGRCSDYILRGRTDCLHVFIHADAKTRAARILQRYAPSDTPPEKRLADMDARRRANYEHYTERTWGVCQNYTLSLDSGVLGTERCVALLAELYAQP